MGNLEIPEGCVFIATRLVTPLHLMLIPRVEILVHILLVLKIKDN